MAQTHLQQTLAVAQSTHSLDERSLSTLTSGIDPVHVLSVLRRLDGTEEVRNPSAFVAKSVSNAKQRGVAPSPQELDNALQLLLDIGTLDEKAVEYLKRTTVESACQALGALLNSDTEKVHNASAYVMRNAANAKRNPGKGGASISSVPSKGKGSVLIPSRSAHPVLGKRALSPNHYPALDEKANGALRAVGPQVAQSILAEMQTKGDVRNPSAYIQKACANANKASGTPAATPYVSPAARRPPSHMWRGELDQDANDALMALGDPQMAQSILQEMASKGNVRNPSAYIQRSVKNLGVSTRQSPGSSSFEALDEHGFEGLDDKAKQALHDIGTEASETVLSNLRERGAAVRNPSAYVVKSAANLTKHSVRSDVATMTSSFAIDESAQEALSTVDPDAAEAILLALETAGEKVTNPSAYVIRAIVNARKGIGGAGAGVGAKGCKSKGGGAKGSSKGSGKRFIRAPPTDIQALSDAAGVVLDEKAFGALQGIGVMSASNILNLLAERGDGVTNPSAYVMKSIANLRNEIAPPMAKIRRLA